MPFRYRLAPVLLVLLAVIGPVSMSSARPLPPARDGGANSGGGNLHRDVIEKQEVRDSIEVAKRGLRYVFGSLEKDYLMSVADQPVTSSTESFKALLPSDVQAFEIFRLLFEPQDSTVFGLISKPKWDIREDEPCFGPKGEPKDASATPPNTVCLSVKRIKDGAKDRGSLTTDILALMAHEFCHLRGGRDSLVQGRYTHCDALQEWIRRFPTRFNYNVKETLESQSNSFYREVSEALLWTGQIEKTVREESNTAAFCEKTQQLRDVIKGLHDRYEREMSAARTFAGYSMSRGYFQWELIGVISRLQHLGLACAAEPTGLKSFWRRYLGLTESKDIPFRALFALKAGAGIWAMGGGASDMLDAIASVPDNRFTAMQEPVHYLKQGDTEALLQDLQSVRQSLKRLQALVL